MCVYASNAQCTRNNDFYTHSGETILESITYNINFQRFGFYLYNNIDSNNTHIYVYVYVKHTESKI